MLPPMMTVLVLAVLWLIVVVPMVIQRLDDRAGERSVARFGGAMRALASRTQSLAALGRPVTRDEGARSEQSQKKSRSVTNSQVFVPGGQASPPVAARRPVPAAMEAIMYPERIAKADMSEARRQMMARRRRSLTLLIAGTILGLGWTIAAGGKVALLVGVLFTVSLTGYLYFLRSQALRDRERRQGRQTRAGFDLGDSYDLTEEIPAYNDLDRVVRIDDDDVALYGIAETVDLTGLYVEEEFDERPMRRAV
jgi:hypothetical protein